MRNVCNSRALAGCSTGIDLRKNSSREGPITDISGYDFIDATKIKMFTCNYDINNSVSSAHFNKIVGMTEPLDHFQHLSIRNGENTISFASSFARMYVSQTSMGSRKLLIVGCAVSGSSIEDWKKRYGPDNPDPDSLHQAAVERLRNVKNLLTPTNTSKVVALLWHQGETNMSIFSNPATSAARKLQYKSNLKETLTGMRREIIEVFNNNSGYTFPILLGGLSYDKQFNRITGVITQGQFRKEMSELIKEVSNPTDTYNIPKSAFVSSDTLSEGGFNRRLEGNSVMNSTGRILGQDDNSHFSATAMREFGRRYFYYYNRIK